MRLMLRLCLLLACVAAPLPAQAKPFKRALVLTGGGFKFLYFVGMYDALVDGGQQPDLIIATCGAAIAAALIQAEPDRDRRLLLLQSPELLQAVRSFRLARGGVRDLELLIRKVSRYDTGWRTGSDVVPDLFSLAFYDEDPVSLRGWQRTFTDRPGSAPRLLIIGAALGTDPTQVETLRNGRSLYREVYFTDPDVAAHLVGFRSLIGLKYPGSAVGVETITRTDFTVGDAAMVSIRDPFLFRPILRDGSYFTGGNVNLYPLELARHLADEVTMTFNTAFNGFEQLAIRVSLGYDMNERLRDVTASPVDRWIDATLAGVKEFSMDPRVEYGFPQLFRLRPFIPMDQQLPPYAPGDSGYRIPAAAEMTRRALVAYDWGYTRGLEAARLDPDGATEHVRRKTPRNFRSAAPASR
jgi:predicted acylesterase/phospholipase RssA